MNFGEAIELLNQGKMLTRKGWNGKGLFVFKQIPAEINKDVVPKMQSLPVDVKTELLKRFNSPGFLSNHIYYDNQMAIVSMNNIINGWAPSVSDTLADDWMLYESTF